MGNQEITALKMQGAPAVVLYSWSVKVLKAMPLEGEKVASTENMFASLLRPLEEQIGGARGLAAKQIAYTLYEIPSIYWHMVYFAVNLMLVCTCYDSGHAIGQALSGPCQNRGFCSEV